MKTNLVVFYNTKCFYRTLLLYKSPVYLSSHPLYCPFNRSYKQTRDPRDHSGLLQLRWRHYSPLYSSTLFCAGGVSSLRLPQGVYLHLGVPQRNPHISTYSFLRLLISFLFLNGSNDTLLPFTLYWLWIGSTLKLKS